MSWSTSELRVRLAPLNRFKPSSKIFYWPFQGGTSFVDLLCFCSVLCLLCFVRVCLYVLRGHLLGKGWPLGSRLWCLLWVCHFPIGILGQVWYLIVSIPDLCNLTYFDLLTSPQGHQFDRRMKMLLAFCPARHPRRFDMPHDHVWNIFWPPGTQVPQSPTPGAWPRRQNKNPVWRCAPHLCE